MEMFVNDDDSSLNSMSLANFSFYGNKFIIVLINITITVYNLVFGGKMLRVLEHIDEIQE